MPPSPSATPPSRPDLTAIPAGTPWLGLRPRGGVLWMLLASALFVAMTAAVKVARDDCSTLEVMLWRAVIALPIIAAVAGRRGVAIVDRRGVLIRSLFGFAAMFCYFSAAGGMGVGDLSLVMRLQPIIIGLWAPLWLGRDERAGGAVWLATGVGLVGCALVLGPEFSLGNVAGAWAIASAFFSAAAHTMLRQVGATDRSSAVVFWFQAFCAVVTVALLAGQGALRLPPAALWPALIATGLCSAFGQLFMTRAYQHERAAVVASAAAIGPLFGVIVDVAFFALEPGWPVFAGGALLVLASAALALGTPGGQGAAPKAGGER